MERTEVAMVVLIGLVVYLLGVDIHESAMEAFFNGTLIFDTTSKISKGNSYICVMCEICIMAGGSVLSCSRKIMIFLVIYLLMTQLKPHIQADNHLGLILVGSNLDVKPIYSRNSGPRHVYSKADKLPSTCKVSKLLNLTESSLLVLSFILLAGDINPQPGPANVLDVPTLDFKARGLSVLHLNVRSLLGKMDQLRLLCERNGANIITLSETWLNKDIDDSEIELPGYSIIRRDRSERTGGGVIIYIRDGLVFSERNDLHNNNEAIWIQVNRTRCKPLIIGCIYIYHL